MITFHSYIHRKSYFLVLDMGSYIEFIGKMFGFFTVFILHTFNFFESLCNTVSHD